jgi:Rha family phage regulatory protein
VAELRQLAAPVVNSRDVAEHFGKRHDNVLRDIEALTTASELRVSNWFREVVYLDAKGESRASFDLTRQGFTQSRHRSDGRRSKITAGLVLTD